MTIESSTEKREKSNHERDSHSERLLEDSRHHGHRHRKIEGAATAAAQNTVDKEIGDVTLTNENKETDKEQKPVGQPNETIQIKSGDKTATLELDEKGMPKQFNDRNGDKIVKREDGWYRESMLYPDGDKLDKFSVDPSDHKVSITYRIPKDENDDKAGTDFAKREIRADGTEETSYDTKHNGSTFISADSSTITTRDGSTKTIAVQKDGKTLQTLKYDGDNLVSFTAPDQSRYEKVTENGKTSWKKYDAAGNADTSFSGSVKGDSNGAIKVTGADTAMRYLPDGTKIESDTNNPPLSRTITKTDGTTIHVATNAQSKSVDSVTISSPDGQTREIHYGSDGQAQVIALRNGDQETTVLHQDAKWVDGNGAPVDVDNYLKMETPGSDPISLTNNKSAEHLRSGDNPIEHRTLVQELPENYQKLLDERLEECRKLDYSNPRDRGVVLGLLYAETKDSGDWDDKQMGGQYQRWGNVAWGAYAKQMNMSYEEAIHLNGIVKTYWNGKSNPEWGSPWDRLPFFGNGFDPDHNKAYGQNPADARAIRDGYRQPVKESESGRWMLAAAALDMSPQALQYLYNPSIASF